MSRLINTLTANASGKFECELFERFKKITKHQGLSQSFVLITLVKQYLENIEKMEK